MTADVGYCPAETSQSPTQCIFGNYIGPTLHILNHSVNTSMLKKENIIFLNEMILYPCQKKKQILVESSKLIMSHNMACMTHLSFFC